MNVFEFAGSIFDNVGLEMDNNKNNVMSQLPEPSEVKEETESCNKCFDDKDKELKKSFDSQSEYINKYSYSTGDISTYMSLKPVNFDKLANIDSADVPNQTQQFNHEEEPSIHDFSEILQDICYNKEELGAYNDPEYIHHICYYKEQNEIVVHKEKELYKEEEEDIVIAEEEDVNMYKGESEELCEEDEEPGGEELGGFDKDDEEPAEEEEECDKDKEEPSKQVGEKQYHSVLILDNDSEMDRDDEALEAFQAEEENTDGDIIFYRRFR